MEENNMPTSDSSIFMQYQKGVEAVQQSILGGLESALYGTTTTANTAIPQPPAMSTATYATNAYTTSVNPMYLKSYGQQPVQAQANIGNVTLTEEHFAVLLKIAEKILRVKPKEVDDLDKAVSQAVKELM
jgi:microcompartment protein CcmL/EutN